MEPSSPQENDEMRTLTPYTLEYTVIDDKRPPFRSELLEVVELTRIYLDRYFSAHYENSELTTVTKTMTLFTNTAFDFGEPIPIEYESSVVFDTFSSILIPDVDDLDEILMSSFQGDNLDGYIGLLQALPPSNMFSTTKFVNLIEMDGDDETMSSSSENSRSGDSTQTITIAATVMGGTVALILVLTTTICLRKWTHRHKSNESASESKSGTLAGETFISRDSYQDDQMMRPICGKLHN